MFKNFSKFSPILLIIYCLLLASCRSVIADHDEYAYQTTNELKTESLMLMAQATDAYTKHALAVHALTEKTSAAYQYAKHIPQNALIVQQWQLLNNPNGHLLGGFMQYWQQQESLSKTYIKHKQQQVAAAFDAILRLEANKPR